MLRRLVVVWLLLATGAFAGDFRMRDFLRRLRQHPFEYRVEGSAVLFRHSIGPETLSALLRPEITPSPQPAAAGTGANVVISPQRLLVVNAGSGLMSNGIPGDSVTALDTSTNQVIATLVLSLGDSPQAIVVAPDNSLAFTANYGCDVCINRGVSVLDPASLQSVGRLAGQFPAQVALTSDGGRLFVADGRVLRVFDGKNGSLLGNLDLGIPLSDFVLTSNDKTLYVLGSSGSPAADRVFTVTTDSLTLAATFDLTAGSACATLALTPNESRLYISCVRSPTIYVFDPSTQKVATSFPTTTTYGLAFSPDGKKLYATHAESATVEILDPANGNRLNQLQVGNAPVGIVVNRNGTRGYVACANSNTVAVLDLQNETILTSVGVGPAPLALALTSLPGPTVPAGAVVNAASFAQGAPVAAGSLVSIFGTNFGASSPLSAGSLPLPTVLGDVKVLMGGTAAPLVYVSSTQINCQVPFELAGQSSAPVVVQSGGAPSAPITVQLAAAAPGIFTATLGNRSQGAILNKDSTLNTPTNPARPGETVQIFATGQGEVTNAPRSGAPAGSSPLSTTPTAPVVLIGGRQVEVAFSGLTPGFVGLWQVNAVVPSGVTPGDSVSVQILYKNALSNSTVMAVASP